MATVAELRAAAAAGKIPLTMELGGAEVAFTFRKPTAREWMDYDAARTSWGVVVTAGNAGTAHAKEMFEQAEQLCVRVITSHTPQQLQDLNEEHLGIFFELGAKIADVVDQLRAGVGKASPPPGGA